MTSTELRQSVYSHSPDARRARQNLIAVRAEIERIGGLMQFQLTTTGGTSPDEPAIVSVAASDTLDVLNRYHIAEKLILESAIAAEIPALDALYAQIAEAEAAEAAAATLTQSAQNAVYEAEEVAKAKLLAKVDQDAAVKAARAQLEALQPAPAPVDPAVAKARAIAAATPRLGKPLGELDHDANPEPLDLDRELIADFH
jgi:hypothetical protein